MRKTSTIAVLLLLLLFIALAESLSMFLLSGELSLEPMEFWRVTLIDAVGLALVLAPFIYFVFIRPHRALQQRFLRVLDTAPDAIVELDRSGRIVFANPAALRLGGYGADELIGHHFAKFLPADQLQSGREALERAKRGETLREVETALLNRSGEIVEVEISALPEFHKGVFGGGVAVFREIAQRKLAEIALRESEWRYRLLFENNPLPMWVYDLETLAFVEVNAAAVALYGYSHAQFLDMTIVDIRPQDEVPALLERVRDRRAGLAARSGAQRHMKQDGSIIHVDIIANPISFSGRPSVLILANDVTERMRIEGQLRHAQKMEAVGQLAGGIAHDFNNMLSVIAMYANLLHGRLAAEPELAGWADQVLAATERAANLTRSLLTFSRKESPRRAPVEPGEVVGSLAKLLRRVLGEEIDLRIELLGRQLTVLADRGQLEQVVMNLCTNARDAMPQGGRLTIGIGEFEIDADFVQKEGFGNVGRYALLRISDAGVGMDEATLARVFEPFFTTKEVGKGTGLGLSIVYGIVKQHDGFITVNSRPGAGTTFRIYLPLIAAASEEALASVTTSPPGGSECILLAEDEEQLRTVTAAVLTGHGYRVITAADGEEALARFRGAQERVQLFIADVIMPRKRGFEAFQEMRREDPDLKVLYMSGYTGDQIEQGGIVSGALNYLPKPASPAVLLFKVREVLDAP